MIESMGDTQIIVEAIETAATRQWVDGSRDLGDVLWALARDIEAKIAARDEAELALADKCRERF